MKKLFGFTSFMAFILMGSESPWFPWLNYGCAIIVVLYATCILQETP